MAGPDTKATAAGVMTTRSAMPSMRAGPETTGPVTTAITGTTPEQAAMAAADPPQPCRASMPSDTSAPLEASSRTRGIRSCIAVRAATVKLSPSRLASAPRRRSEAVRANTASLPSKGPKVQLDGAVDPGTYRGHVARGAAPSPLIL